MSNAHRGQSEPEPDIAEYAGGRSVYDIEIRPACGIDKEAGPCESPLATQKDTGQRLGASTRAFDRKRMIQLMALRGPSRRLGMNRYALR
jgi:hypothetical protein